MSAISPAQLSTIAAFLEMSRNYLDVEHTIRLRWPYVKAEAPHTRKPKPARRAKPRADHKENCCAGRL